MEYEIYFQAEPRGAIRLEPEGLFVLASTMDGAVTMLKVS